MREDSFNSTTLCMIQPNSNSKFLFQIALVWPQRKSIISGKFSTLPLQVNVFQNWFEFTHSGHTAVIIFGSLWQAKETPKLKIPR